MNKELLKKVSELKRELLIEGFIIIGIFGSYSRDDFNSQSDIDILYDLDKTFKDKYKGFKAIARLDDIRKNLSSKLDIEADLVQMSTLGSISEKYIVPEVYHV